MMELPTGRLIKSRLLGVLCTPEYVKKPFPFINMCPRDLLRDKVRLCYTDQVVLQFTHSHYYLIRTFLSSFDLYF